MSEKIAVGAPGGAVTNDKIIQAILEAADEVDVAENASKSLAEKQDPDFQSKLRKLQNMKFKDEQDLVNRFPFQDELFEEEGVYLWNEYIVLDQTQVSEVLKFEWADMNPSTGRIRFSSHLKQRFIGISNPQVTEFLAANEDHQMYRQRRRSTRTMPTVASRPFSVLVFDCTDIPKTGSYISLLNVCDLYSKFGWSFPLVNKKAKTIVSKMDELFKSLPEGARVGSVRSDNGTEFKNSEMTAFLKARNVKQVFSTAGNALSNGAIEVFNRTIKTSLFSGFNNDRFIGSFVPKLKKTLLNYNNTVHSAHGRIPSQIARPDLDAVTAAEVSKRLRAKSGEANSNARYQPPLQPGDRVRLAVESIDGSIKLKIKSGVGYKKSHNPTFSEQVFTVKRQNADGFVEVEERLPSTGGVAQSKFMRGDVLLIPNK